MASTSTVTFELTVQRSGVNRGTKTLPNVVTISDIKEAQFIEKKLAAGGTLVAVPFGFASADALVVFTSKPVFVRLNGSGNPQIRVGSEMVILDTAITSIHFDNTISSPAEELTVEVWALTKT